VLLVIEFLTLSLTTVWFAGGALVTAIAAEFGAPFIVQVVVFLAGSLTVLFLLRPSVVRLYNGKRQKTNVSALIGQEAKVIETVNNKENTGVATINGQEWTARTMDSSEVLEEGTWAVIEEISGVKLILKKKDNKEE
jgi:membrane protein implicated in regulation of membrane protease activity